MIRGCHDSHRSLDCQNPEELRVEIHSEIHGCFDRHFFHWNMGVNPKIGGKPPKWMAKIRENPIKMDDLGVPLLLETPI